MVEESKGLYETCTNGKSSLREYDCMFGSAGRRIGMQSVPIEMQKSERKPVHGQARSK